MCPLQSFCPAILAFPQPELYQVNHTAKILSALAYPLPGIAPAPLPTPAVMASGHGIPSSLTVSLGLPTGLWTHVGGTATMTVLVLLGADAHKLDIGDRQALDAQHVVSKVGMGEG